jgi:hypothetical protein
MAATSAYNNTGKRYGLQQAQQAVIKMDVSSNDEKKH